MQPDTVREFIHMGSDQGRGNLVGVQPFMLTTDYASESAFHARLNRYLEAAEGMGWLNSRSVIVFPEYIGTWLVAADEAPSVYEAASTAQAMRPLAMRRPFAFLLHMLAAAERDRATAAVFRLKAAHAAGIYQRVFAGLAGQYGVTIVAGSILLPEPAVQNGVVACGSGRIYNASAVFQPDGRAYPNLVRKAFPIDSELPFVTPAPVEDLPVFDTPAGRLGVLICADSWYPAAYQTIARERVEILAVPSFASGNNAWEQPWGGYNGSAAPADVDPADVGSLSEGQAWRKYALAGRLAQSGARHGVNIFLHGNLWDLGSNSGQSVLVDGEQVNEARSQADALLNLWL